MVRSMFELVGLSFLFGASCLAVAEDSKTKPRDDSGLDEISRIMLKAHLTPGNRSTRDNLDNKVIDGKATEAEKQRLLDLYTAFGKAKPPQGSPDAWKERTGELVEALKAVYRGEPSAKDRFVRARDCKACHTLHRAPS